MYRGCNYYLKLWLGTSVQSPNLNYKSVNLTSVLKALNLANSLFWHLILTVNFGLYRPSVILNHKGHNKTKQTCQSYRVSAQCILEQDYYWRYATSSGPYRLLSVCPLDKTDKVLLYSLSSMNLTYWLFVFNRQGHSAVRQFRRINTSPSVYF